jgi:hypothetical protein
MSDLAVGSTYAVMLGYWRSFIKDQIDFIRKFRVNIDEKIKTVLYEEKKKVLPVYEASPARLYNFKGEIVREFYENGRIVNLTA